MKKAVIALSLFSSMSYIAQNKIPTEGEIVYSVVFGKNGNIEAEERQYKEILEKIFSSEKDAKLSIKYNAKNRLSVPEAQPDVKTKKELNLSQIMLEDDGIFYTDLVNNVVYNDTTLEDKNVIVKHNIPELKWNISDETKIINGYKAIKATAEYKFEKENGKQIYREAIAWFSEEIPLQVAPKQFYGLPGLVISLQEGGATYTLESIQDKKVKVDYKVNEKRVISVDDYMDLINELD